MDELIEIDTCMSCKSSLQDYPGPYCVICEEINEDVAQEEALYEHFGPGPYTDET